MRTSMRIALARLPGAELPNVLPDDASVALLDVNDATARALATALGAEPADGAVLVVGTSATVVSGEEWTARGLAERAPIVSDHGPRAPSVHDVIAESLGIAARAISEALPRASNPVDLLEKLRAVLMAAGRYEDAVSVAVAIAETAPSAEQRARAFVEAATLCTEKAGNTPRAVALYEAAIADDPEVTGAFEAIETVLILAEDFLELEKAYIRQLQRLADRGATHAERFLLRKLATLREVRLDNRAGAIASLDRLVRQEPSDVEARVKLSELLEAGGEVKLAVRCLEMAAEHDPHRLETFRSLSRIFQGTSNPDRAFAAVSVLVHLGEATEQELELYERHAPHATLAFARALTEADLSTLFPTHHDRELGDVLRAIAPAACAVRLSQLRASKKVPVLDPSERQDVEKTTLTAVRAVAWANRVLGAQIPEIYVRNADISGGVLALPIGRRAVILGRSLLTGRSVPELSFVVARDIAFRAATADLLVYFPTVAEIRALLLAAMSLVLPGLSAGPDVLAFRDALVPGLDPGAKASLTEAVRRLTERGPQVDVLAFLQSVETMACRAGLLATGDLTVASRMLAVDPHAVSKLTGAERIRDLVSFAVSSSYAELRDATGVAIRP